MKRFLNLRLSFLIALSLIVGISTGYFIFMGQKVLAIVFPSFIALFLIIYLICSFVKRKFISPVVIFFICVIMGFGGYFSFNGCLKDYQTCQEGNHYYDKIEGRVEEVSNTTSGIKLTIDALVISDKNIAGKMNVYARGESSIDVGDFVEFSGYVSTNSSVYEGVFSAYNVVDDIKYVCTLDSTDKIIVGERDRTIFESVNILIRDTLAKGLEGDEFAVAYALLTGNGEYFDDEVITNFRQAGVAHIFAVSGLHIGFLYAVLNFILKKLRLNKYASVIIIACSLFFYSGVCGFSASSIRASVMCTVMMITKLFGEKYDGLSSLSISCVIVLLISPVQLFLVGFQLSFMVVFGILTCTPFLKRVFRFLPNKIASGISTCLPAYLFGIPMCLYAFGEFSTIAIIVNLLFIPVVSIIFITLLVCTLISALIGCEVVVLFIPKYILKAVVFLINIFDYEIFMVGGFTFGIYALCYYASMLVACGFFNFNKIAKIIVSLLLVVTCAFGVTLKTISYNNQTRYIVSGDDYLSFTLVDAKDEHVLILSDASRLFNDKRLLRAVDKASCSSLSVVFMNTPNLDVQQTLTKINHAVKVDKVYFYAPREDSPELVENIIKSSFLGVEVISYTGGHLLTCSSVKISAESDGYSIRVDEGENSLCVFTKFGSDLAGYDRLSYSPTSIVAYDYLENIYGYYKPSKLISYRTSYTLDNGERQGNFVYSFD